MVDAKDAAEALGVNARVRLSNDSPPEEDGGTARMVGRRAGGASSGMTSSSTSGTFSSSSSGGGDDGVVLSCENLKDDGVNEDAMSVSSSDRLVLLECLVAFFRDRIGCGVGVWLASNFATTLATFPSLETQDPGRSGFSSLSSLSSLSDRSGRSNP